MCCTSKTETVSYLTRMGVATWDIDNVKLIIFVLEFYLSGRQCNKLVSSSALCVFVHALGEVHNDMTVMIVNWNKRHKQMGPYPM